MLDILLMIILIIILFIIVLLYIGVRISLIYNKTGRELKGCLKILILRKIKVYSLEFPSSDDEDEIEEEIEDEEKEEDDGKDKKELFKLAKPCFKDFKIFLESFVKCIRVQRLDNHLIFGMDSYASTAKYIGYIWGLFIIVNDAHKNAHLTAEPSFNGSVFDGHGINDLEINILKVIPPAIKLICKKEVRTLIRGVING